MIEYKLPSLGSDMERGRLLEWKVKPGDKVKRGDVIAVVDTSKAAIDVEIWQEGTVHELLLGVNDDVPVGTPMLRLLGAGETAPAPAVAPPTPVPAPAVAITAPRAAARTPPSAAAPPAAARVPDAGRRRISPAARKRAEELHVDLDRVPGTGPDGAVTIEDVARAATPQEAPAADRGAAMRRTIAAAMSRSKREIPHYYLATDIPLERATAWLTRTNAQRPVTARILMAALFLKATALAARKYPELNGFYREERFEPGTGVHLGVAVSLRQGGLIAPGLLDTDRMSLEALMSALTDLVKRARAFTLRASELSAPTMTVTNLGDQGVELVQGVIYPPQVALVGFGKVTPRAWVEGNALRLIPVVTASLAADHRVSDGHRGALFLAAVRDLLQQPDQL